MCMVKAIIETGIVPEFIVIDDPGGYHARWARARSDQFAPVD